MAEKFTYITLDDKPEQAFSTKEMIIQQLTTLGIQKGMVLYIQTDMRKLGYLAGGVQTLLDALMDCVGFEGTLVIPTFTMNLADPSCQRTRINRKHWKDARINALPFHRKLSAPDHDDPFTLQFLRNEGVVRSYHPIYSFAAWGKYAKFICDKHPLHFGLGEDSPLGKILEFNGYIVLLGEQYHRCTLLNLASYKKEKQPIRIISAPIENNQSMIWKDMLELSFKDAPNETIGEYFETNSLVTTSYIGNGKCHMLNAREAIKWTLHYDAEAIES